MTEIAVQRVKAYVAAYHEKWSELYERVSDEGDFEAWAQAMADIAELHCTPGGNELDRYSIGSPPAHDPAEEVVLDSAVEGPEQSTVLTQCGDYRFFEYELQLVDGQWRITHIRQTAADPRELMIEPAALDELLAQATEETEWTPLSDQEDPTNSLFDEGREFHIDRDIDKLKVRRLGKIDLTSGVLAIQDLGYDAQTLAPLQRRIAPGQYPVEVASAFGRNMAMRVLLGDPARVVAWHPANVSGGSHVFGVDAGNLAVFDLSSFDGLTVGRKERVYDDTVVNPTSFPAADMLSLARPNDGAVAHSGWGDGAYPAHWGVDEAGAPIVLLVDFLVTCRWPTDTVQLDVTERSPGFLSHERLAEADVSLRIDDDGRGAVLEVGGETAALKILDADGAELCNVKWLGCQWSAGVTTYELPDEVMSALPWTLHIEIGKGYRNDD